MAADKKEKPEATPEEVVAPETEKKKPNILLIVIGALVFLLVVSIGGFIGYTQLPSVVSEIAGTPQSAAPQEQIVRYVEVKDIMQLEQFLVNLADIDNISLLRATFQLGVTEQANEDPVEMAAIRDAIISLLTSKTSYQIMTNEGKENLREEIRTLINTRPFAKNRVVEVYITDFIVQL